MTRFAITNLACLLGAGATLLLPSEVRLLAVGAVFSLWVLVVSLGAMRLEFGMFCRAVSRAPYDAVGPPAVALTFDDGPDPAVTPKLLDLLARRNVEVAFFVIGRRVARHPELARRAAEAGHLVENHSHRHLPWTNFFFTRAMTRELKACSAEIEAAVGVAPRYYRPPFGLSNHAIVPASRNARLRIVGWQARGFDSRSANPDAVVNRILKRVRPGGIILLHDGSRDPDRLLEVTDKLLDGLAKRGFETKRLDRLLAWPSDAEARPVCQTAS